MTKNGKHGRKVVADYMTHDVFTIRFDKKMITVKNIMDWAHIRHVPVVNREGGVVGMLSHRDLLAASFSTMGNTTTDFDRKRQLWSIPIEQVMQQPVVMVKPSTTIAQVARFMLNRKIGALPVVDDHKLVGIITEHDLLRALNETLNVQTEESALAGLEACKSRLSASLLRNLQVVIFPSH